MQKTVPRVLIPSACQNVFCCTHARDLRHYISTNLTAFEFKYHSALAFACLAWIRSNSFVTAMQKNCAVKDQRDSNVSHQSRRYDHCPCIYLSMSVQTLQLFYDCTIFFLRTIVLRFLVHFHNLTFDFPTHHSLYKQRLRSLLFM